MTEVLRSVFSHSKSLKTDKDSIKFDIDTILSIPCISNGRLNDTIGDKLAGIVSKIRENISIHRCQLFHPNHHFMRLVYNKREGDD